MLLFVVLMKLEEGPLAGPVVACATILNSNPQLFGP